MPRFPVRPVQALLLAVLTGAGQPAHATERCADRAVAASQRNGFAAAATRVAPSVVTVIVVRPVAQDEDRAAGFFGTSGLPLPGEREGRALERSFSSGFVLDGDGFIVSSAHGVARARQVLVELADGRKLAARVVGADRRNDVALLKVEATGLVAMDPARRAVVSAGDVLAALGAPFGFERSVTAGVVSAPLRLLPGMRGVPLIQSDVVLNPGSSGGPLFNAEGRVLAMSSMIFSDSGIYVGVSFAIHIDRVLRVAAALREGRTGRELGIVTQAVTPDLARAFGLDAPRGALVASVPRSSPAATSGLRGGDIVLRVNAVAVADQAEAEDALADAPASRDLPLEVWRQGRVVRVSIPAQAPGVPVADAPPAATGRLGLTLLPASATVHMPGGLAVDASTGTALLAGVEAGDRVTAVNGRGVATVADFDAALEATAGSEVVALLVWRGNAPLFIAVRLRLQ